VRAVTLGHMHMSVAVTGGERPSGEALSLSKALLSDPDLRSVEVRGIPQASSPGSMSSAGDVLLIAFGAGGIGATVVQTLCTWLAGRRRDVRLSVTQGDRTVEIDVTRARDMDEVVALYRQLDSSTSGSRDGEAGA